MQTQTVVTVAMIMIGGATTGIGMFQLLAGRGRPRAAAERILVGLSMALVGVGYSTPGVNGMVVIGGGLAIALGASTMMLRRKRLEGRSVPPLPRE